MINGTLMNAILFHDASGRCASSYPTLQPSIQRDGVPTFRFSLLLYSDLHLTFHASRFDADPSAEDGTIFLFSFFTFHKLYLLTCQRSSSAFHNFLFYCEERGANFGRPWPALPASFYYSRYPGGCMTFWVFPFSCSSLSFPLWF